MRARADGAWREVEGGQVYVAGAWRQLSEARAYISGAWETVATFIPSLSLEITPTIVGASITGAGVATSNAATATPTGGSAPFTYSWARVGGVSGSPDSPTNATTTFSKTLGNGDETGETFRCTCTDSFGTTATADISVTFNSIFIGGE